MKTEPWEAVYIGCGDWDLKGPVTREDWKLAAAAPDLLEALKDMLDNHEDACTGYGEGAAEKARAAIAKAEAA